MWVTFDHNDFTAMIKRRGVTFASQQMSVNVKRLWNLWIFAETSIEPPFDDEPLRFQSRIVNGTKALVAQFPYQVAAKNSNLFLSYQLNFSINLSRSGFAEKKLVGQSLLRRKFDKRQMGFRRGPLHVSVSFPYNNRLLWILTINVL